MPESRSDSPRTSPEWLAAGGNWEAASGDVDATAFDVGDSESAAAPRFEPFYLLALLPLLFHA